MSTEVYKILLVGLELLLGLPSIGQSVGDIGCDLTISHKSLFKYLVVNLPPWSEEGIIGMHFVCRSVHPSVTFRVRAITYICINGLPSYLVQILSSIR